jgi:hypothetical protein
LLKSPLAQGAFEAAPSAIVPNTQARTTVMPTALRACLTRRIVAGVGRRPSFERAV